MWETTQVGEKSEIWTTNSLGKRNSRICSWIKATMQYSREVAVHFAMATDLEKGTKQTIKSWIEKYREGTWIVNALLGKGN